MERARRGDARALDALAPLVYAELRAIAHRQLAKRRSGQTLDTTALVHEAYLKLARGEPAGWGDRSHFFAVAATAMRHIIVDYARTKNRKKRGGGAPHTILEDALVGIDPRTTEVLALDESLTELSKLDPKLTQTVELRFFAGLTVGETATVQGVSERTIKRNWQKAMALLRQLLDKGAA